MIHSPRFTAVLDACILYPAPIRDLLLHLASVGLFTPKWTARIHTEWTRNLLQNRPDLTAAQLQRTVTAMQTAFPAAEVENYETLIAALALPDPNDRHVLAAAIRCQASVIVTANLKDFPVEVLAPFDMEAQHPDEFIATLIDLNPHESLTAFEQQISFLRNPPRTAAQVLDNFRQVQLSVTADKLSRLL